MSNLNYVPVRELGMHLILVETLNGRLYFLRDGIARFRTDNEDLDLMSSPEEVNLLAHKFLGELMEFRYGVTIKLLEGPLSRSYYNNFLNFEEADAFLVKFFSENPDYTFKVAILCTFPDGMIGEVHVSLDRETICDDEVKFSTEAIFMKDVNYYKERSLFEAERVALKDIADRMDFLENFDAATVPGKQVTPVPEVFESVGEFTETVPDIY